MSLTKLKIADAEVSYFSRFLTDKQGVQYFNLLKHEIQWRQDPIKLFGKTYLQPRLTALYGTDNRSYSYSGITMFPEVFNETLDNLKSMVEKETHTIFNTCLLNYYRDGRDSNGWHSDDEKELGNNPTIASLSLGAGRWFHLKHKYKAQHKHKLFLENGSLLLMKGVTQDNWKHQVPKTTKPVGERINLTFRFIK